MITTGRTEQQQAALRVRRRARDREQRAVTEAVARERLAIAADVHDLIMQDLAFALAGARLLADGEATAGRAATVVAAGERALAGARQLVDALREDQQREPVVEALRSSVSVAARHTPLSFDASGTPAGVQPDKPTLDALVHIGREAVTNAVKHAAPGNVEVVLEHAEEWQLLVRDNGRGFDAGATRAGFGLRSMSGQARALGGSLRVSSALGAGTTVHASLP
jgi:signal transduction histidine kinase